MSTGQKCKNCGSADIEVDNARGDAVCTNCGSVLEDNIIVSEVQFEENNHGAASAVGQFVSAESKGGATGYGKFHVGMGAESREVTLRKARQGITHLSHQLHLNNHCIDTACNFFKMALMRHFTRGRKNTHIYAACVYITCRTEGTSHLLIDISDILQICCYELGKTYLRLSQALCINIPSIDPCLYIMRFANKLEFADKTHEVSMTAQRLVQRMKKDFIHSGRRPSGLCGAALLLAARMHDFNRTPMDIVRIVKIHESTLRKRLIEFGDTPSSALTLDEFMTVDLEAEQDPPAFKIARKRDKERIQRLAANDSEFDALTQEIDAQLEKDLSKMKKRTGAGGEDIESTETDAFIRQSTIDTIKSYLHDDLDNPDDPECMPNIAESGMGPDIAAMCLPEPINNSKNQFSSNKDSAGGDNDVDGVLDLEGIDDDEINGYIMTENESRSKDQIWNKINATYLIESKAREEKLAKEREEGKPEKKKRRTMKRKNIGPSNTVGEAIEKMLQEKKISNKINYDILKTLTGPKATEDVAVSDETVDAVDGTEPITKTEESSGSSSLGILTTKRSSIVADFTPKKAKIERSIIFPASKRARIMPAGLHIGSLDEKPKDSKKIVVEGEDTVAPPHDDADEFEDDVEPEPEPDNEHSSLAQMLKGEGDEEYYGYEEEY